jgi:hypothetical protein
LCSIETNSRWVKTWRGSTLKKIYDTSDGQAVRAVLIAPPLVGFWQVALFGLQQGGNRRAAKSWASRFEMQVAFLARGQLPNRYRDPESPGLFSRINLGQYKTHFLGVVTCPVFNIGQNYSSLKSRQQWTVVSLY